MFNKGEASRIRQNFWTNFGQYMAPVPSTSGNTTNWVNYKTGVKHIRFTMDFTKRNAEVWVEFSFTDKDKRNQVFQTFVSLWKQFYSGDEWIYFEETIKDERSIAAIKSSLEGVNVFDQATWPSAITFLKQKMLLLDGFWEENKEMFEMF